MDYQIGHSKHKSVSTIYLIPLHRQIVEILSHVKIYIF